MKKILIGTIGIISLIFATIVIYMKQDKFEYYDFDNNYGTSPICKVSKKDELICKKGKSWVQVNQYSKVN